jgi:hypothetical protein
MRSISFRSTQLAFPLARAFLRAARRPDGRKIIIRCGNSLLARGG